MSTKMKQYSRNICRLCLSDAGTLVDIFDPPDIEIPHKIYVFTNLQVEADDGCPNLICDECKLKLFDAYQFRIDCIRSNSIFKKYVSDNTTKNRPMEHNLYPNCKSKSNMEMKSHTLTMTTVKNKITQSTKNRRQAKSNNHQSKEATICAKDTANMPVKKHSSRVRFKEKFEKLKILKTHSDVPNEKCDICGKTFKSIGYLSHHMRVHNGLKPYHCKICSKTFSQNSALIVHLRRHSGDKPYMCNLCGKGFTQSGNLAVHHRSHTGERPFQCDTCAKSFSQVGNLYIHKRIHTGERQYECEMCDKAFKFPSHLAEHARIHSTDKQFHCSICDKGFHKSSYLSTHMRIHTGEKPYKCDHCGKSFSNSSNLAAHIRIHTGSKPYVCKYCSKGFAQSSALVRHIKQHKLPAKSEKQIEKSAECNLHKLKTILPTDKVNEKSIPLKILNESTVYTDSLYEQDVQSDAAYIKENKKQIELTSDRSTIQNINVLKKCHIKSAPSAKSYSSTVMTIDSPHQGEIRKN